MSTAVKNNIKFVPNCNTQTLDQNVFFILFIMELVYATLYAVHQSPARNLSSSFFLEHAKPSPTQLQNNVCLSNPEHRNPEPAVVTSTWWFLCIQCVMSENNGSKNLHPVSTGKFKMAAENRFLTGFIFQFHREYSIVFFTFKMERVTC